MPVERQGISTVDMITSAKIWTREGWPLPQRYFHYVAPQDLWELWRIQPNGTHTLVATRNTDTQLWDDNPD